MYEGDDKDTPYYVIGDGTFVASSPWLQNPYPGGARDKQICTQCHSVQQQWSVCRFTGGQAAFSGDQGLVDQVSAATTTKLFFVACAWSELFLSYCHSFFWIGFAPTALADPGVGGPGGPDPTPFRFFFFDLFFRIFIFDFFSDFFFQIWFFSDLIFFSELICFQKKKKVPIYEK